MREITPETVRSAFTDKGLRPAQRTFCLSVVDGRFMARGPCGAITRRTGRHPRVPRARR